MTDEGERFVKVGIEKFVRSGDRLALAATVCITTGGRTNEVLKRDEQTLTSLVQQLPQKVSSLRGLTASQ